MSNREALRELQSRLAERLQAVRTDSSQASWLAVECAGQGLLRSICATSPQAGTTAFSRSA